MYSYSVTLAANIGEYRLRRSIRGITEYSTVETRESLEKLRDEIDRALNPPPAQCWNATFTGGTFQDSNTTYLGCLFSGVRFDKKVTEARFLSCRFEDCFFPEGIPLSRSEGGYFRGGSSGQ